MDIRLLGSVEARVDGRAVTVAPGKPRALLALLALNAGSTVSSDRLIDGLWGERPPATAVKLVQLHVSQLRKAFSAAGDGGQILTRGHGYELRLGPDDLDVTRFERLMAGGRPREALTLWRGPALDDVAGEPFAAAEIARFEELRLAAVEQAIGIDLVEGRHREVVGELERLVIEEPLRETLHLQRMLALYRSGRQADALKAYRHARTVLVERMGVEPGPELRRLHEAILRQDQLLESQPVALDELKRARAVRRVAGAASRLAAERPALRAVEDDLAGSIVELQAGQQRSESGRLADDDVVVCPFKGLAPFDVEDADFFFGRERLVAELVARLTGAPLTGIVGPSGSGKSSALRAGLLPALAAGVLPGSERWPIAMLRPGEHPLRALEESGAQVASEVRLVVAVDQFEELFTACRDEDARAAFADALVACVRDPRRRALVLVAIRADFYGRCASYPELARLLGASHVLVGAMRRDELRRAIEQPARRAGLEVEPELVDALLADVEGRPGALPLLSTALLELWQRRDGRRLRLTAYEHAGGVHGAVARLAERAYERLGPEQRPVARRILLRLAGAGAGETVVRRRVPLDELEGDGVAEVLAVLAGDRLVTIGEGEVEVAHEALLREWPRLRGWLEEDAQGRQVHLHLREAAREWAGAGRDPGELYRGARLAAVLDWSTVHADELNAAERDFVAASRAASQRSQRRVRAVLVGLAALLALAVVAGVVALEQRGSARSEAVAAQAQRVGARALVEDDLDHSLLLARQGVALDDSLQTRGNLLAALLKSPAAIGVLRGDGDRLVALELSPDERTLVFMDNDNMLSFVDRATRRAAGATVTVTGEGIMDVVRRDDLQFSPDGARLAVGGAKPVVMDARSRRVLARLPSGPAQFIYASRFSPDGRTLLAATAFPLEGVTTVQRFDAHTGKPVDTGRRVSRGLVTLMLTVDGKRVVTTGAEDTTIRDARTLRPLQRWPVGADQAALSPDDRTLLAGGSDGSVRFLDLVTGDVAPGSGRHNGRVERAAFSPDGRQAITAGEDGRVIVWDVERASAGETLEGHAAKVTGLAITRDGQTLYTSSLDGRIIVWDLAGARRLGRLFTVGADNPDFPRYALSPDGRDLAVGQVDGTVALIDARTLKLRRGFPVVQAGPVRGMGYAPGGRLLVVAGDGGFLALVDPRSGRTVKRLTGQRDLVYTPSFTADGRLMATASDHRIRLYALPSGRPLGRALVSRSVIHDVSLSPDGQTLAVTRAPRHAVEILEVATLRRRTTLPGSETVREFAHFTPDGRFLVGTSWKGWAQLWSTETWRPAGRRFGGHAGGVEWASVSPDGHTLATGSADGMVRLWDLPTQQPLGAPLPGVPNRIVLPQFTPDGAYLFAIYGDGGRAYRWDVRPSSWARHACAVAGRTLTRFEWQDALPERDYAPACTR
jgi:WD40 repeat protein/DNA-binding SARP family transcriptional activator